jgi:hypothetical protein
MWNFGGVAVDPDIKYSSYTPIVMNRSQLEQSSKIQNALALQDPGKIYFRNPYIFVNEKYKGIHIIDNSNPASPQNIQFINIPGNVDMAVKGNTLYADNSVDLLVLDISQINDIKIIKRLKNKFPNPITSPDGFQFYDIDQNQFVVGWQKK